MNIDISYEKSKEYVLNKDKAISSYIRYMLNRTQSMFEYFCLPETIPQMNLEFILQTRGYCFITEHEGKLYALSGSLGGELNVYDEPSEIVISNSALRLSKTYDIEKDGVLMRSDTLMQGLLPILQKYGVMLSENTISIRTVDIILRMAMLISAPDDRTYQSARRFVSDIEQGKISVIGESAFFDGLKTHNITNAQNYLTQFIEIEQYLKASCFNEIGLNANWNAKRENLQSNEVSLNDDFLLPLVDNMIKCRSEAIEKINDMYDTDIRIDYASAWKVTHEENEKQIAMSESVTATLENGETTANDISITSKDENIEIGFGGEDDYNDEGLEGEQVVNARGVVENGKDDFEDKEIRKGEMNNE